MLRHVVERLPGGIEREVERVGVDGPLQVGQPEVVIEKVQAIFRNQDALERVLEQVGDLLILERGIGGEAASPPKRIRVVPSVVVDMRE